jgi:hypothetical protein
MSLAPAVMVIALEPIYDSIDFNFLNFNFLNFHPKYWEHLQQFVGWLPYNRTSHYFVMGNHSKAMHIAPDPDLLQHYCTYYESLFSGSAWDLVLMIIFQIPLNYYDILNAEIF